MCPPRFSDLATALHKVSFIHYVSTFVAQNLIWLHIFFFSKSKRKERKFNFQYIFHFDEIFILTKFSFHVKNIKLLEQFVKILWGIKENAYVIYEWSLKNNAIVFSDCRKYSKNSHSSKCFENSHCWKSTFLWTKVAKLGHLTILEFKQLFYEIPQLIFLLCAKFSFVFSVAPLMLSHLDLFF